MTKKPVLFAAVAGALVLSGCADPRFQQGGDLERTGQGALAGAVTGGILGAATAGDDRGKSAAIGAALGAAGGAAIGNVLDRQARELRNDFDNSAIDVVNNGDQLLVRMPQDILFATDSASVNSTLRSDLGVLAGSLNRYPNSVVQVVGHTDNTGSAAYNQTLSERRAQSVVSILNQNGVSAGRLQAIGRGEDEPIASNLTDSGRAQNRRVDIIIRPTT
ncbi:Outer membrane protein OmpA [Tranquillimonas rosea]|uniref:Outer membrane protein OmpA n=1 Tax=Tranquillimonas rosea TaxID=641238 RepID=A0A1H9QZ96_9RHOB|nr:OmpA family protein [Tranquillimonas rosea]SER65931.1 Outer membrane protein OmpA [Tranquillimonas rosea]